jgi:GntR family transcriptional repressor for pyruvate dehydrogenase complex
LNGSGEIRVTYNGGVKSGPPADRDSLSDQVTRYVIEHIRGSGLGPGEKVPSEIRTSAHLQISRGVVREAYRSLRAAGILEISNGRVPRVSQLNNKAFVQILEHGLSTQQATVEHILDLRCSIEIRAAELAAVNRSARHVKELEQEIADFEKAKKNQELWVQADMRFHLIIGEASANPFFGLLSAALRQALEVSIRTGLDRRTSWGEIDQMVETHKLVARAIIARNSREARKQMITHFDEARAAILNAHDNVHPSRKILWAG